MFHAINRLPWPPNGFGSSAKTAIKSLADYQEAQRLVRSMKPDQNFLCLGWFTVLVSCFLLVAYVWHRHQRRRKSQLLATVAGSTKRKLMDALREKEAQAAMLGAPDTASSAFSRVANVRGEYLRFRADSGATELRGAGTSDNPVRPRSSVLRVPGAGLGLDDDAYESDSAEGSARTCSLGSHELQQLRQIFKVQLAPTPSQLVKVQALSRKPRRCIGGCSCFQEWTGGMRDGSGREVAEPHPFLQHCVQHADTGIRPDGIAHLSTVAVRLGGWLRVTYCTTPKEATQRVAAHQQQPLAHHLANLLQAIVREVAVNFHTCTDDAVHQLLSGLSSESQLRMCSMMCVFAAPATPSPAIPLLLLRLVSSCSAASYAKLSNRITTLASLVVDDFVDLLKADMAEPDGPLSSLLGSMGPLSVLNTDPALVAALRTASCAASCGETAPDSGHEGEGGTAGDEGEGAGEEGADEGKGDCGGEGDTTGHNMEAAWFILEGLLIVSLRHSPSLVHRWMAQVCTSRHRSDAFQLNAAMAVLGLACRTAKHVKYASNLPPHAPQLPSLRVLRPLVPLPAHLDPRALYPASPQAELQELCQLAIHDLILPAVHRFKEQRRHLSSAPQRVLEMHSDAWSGVICHRRFTRHLMSALGFQSVWLLRHLAPLLDPEVVAARHSPRDTTPATRLDVTSFWLGVQRAADKLGGGVTSHEVMGVLGTVPVRCLIDLCRGVEMMVQVQPAEQLTAVARKSLCHTCDVLVVLLALPEVHGDAAKGLLLRAAMEALEAVQEHHGDSVLATRPTAKRHLLPALCRAYASLPELRGGLEGAKWDVSLRLGMLRLMREAMSYQSPSTLQHRDAKVAVLRLLHDAVRLVTLPHARDESLELVGLAVEQVLSLSQPSELLHDMANLVGASLVSLLRDLSYLAQSEGVEEVGMREHLGRALLATSRLAEHVLDDDLLAAALPGMRLQQVVVQLRALAEGMAEGEDLCGDLSAAAASAIAELCDAVHTRCLSSDTSPSCCQGTQLHSSLTLAHDDAGSESDCDDDDGKSEGKGLARERADLTLRLTGSCRLPAVVDMSEAHRDVARLRLVVAETPGVYMACSPTEEVVQLLIAGPADSPFAHGLFHFQLCLPQGYPSALPSLHFATGSRGAHWPAAMFVDAGTLLATSKVTPNRRGLLSKLLAAILEMFTPAHACSKQQMCDIEELRCSTIVAACSSVLAMPPPAFADAVGSHFRSRRDALSHTLAQWKPECDARRAGYMAAAVSALQLQLGGL